MHRIILAGFIAICLPSLHAQESYQQQPGNWGESGRTSQASLDRGQTTLISCVLWDHSFGEIPENGGNASHIFWVRNEGPGVAVLTRVSASCGCTATEWSREPVAPGDSTAITVSYDPLGRPGVFQKTVSVYSNGQPYPLQLRITGDVKREE
jgi:hypothetical protein